MQYRQTRQSSNPPPSAVAPSPQSQPQQQQQQTSQSQQQYQNSSGNRWANTGPQASQPNDRNAVAATRNPPPRVASAIAASGTNATTTIRKVNQHYLTCFFFKQTYSKHY